MYLAVFVWGLVFGSSFVVSNAAVEKISEVVNKGDK